MSEQIPAGFTEQTWAALSPEQKQAYLQAQNQTAAQNTASVQDHSEAEAKYAAADARSRKEEEPSKASEIAGEAGSMVKSAAKWALFGTLVGVFSNLFSSIINMFTGDD